MPAATDTDQITHSKPEQVGVLEQKLAEMAEQEQHLLAETKAFWAQHHDSIHRLLCIGRLPFARFIKNKDWTRGTVSWIAVDTSMDHALPPLPDSLRPYASPQHEYNRIAPEECAEIQDRVRGILGEKVKLDEYNDLLGARLTAKLNLPKLNQLLCLLRSAIPICYNYYQQFDDGFRTRLAQVSADYCRYRIAANEALVLHAKLPSDSPQKDAFDKSIARAQEAVEPVYAFTADQTQYAVQARQQLTADMRAGVDHGHGFTDQSYHQLGFLPPAETRQYFGIKKHFMGQVNKLFKQVRGYYDEKVDDMQSCCSWSRFFNHDREEAKRKVSLAAQNVLTSIRNTSDYQGRRQQANALIAAIQDNPLYNQTTFGKSKANELVHQVLDLCGVSPLKQLEIDIENYLKKKALAAGKDYKRLMTKYASLSGTALNDNVAEDFADQSCLGDMRDVAKVSGLVKALRVVADMKAGVVPRQGERKLQDFQDAAEDPWFVKARFGSEAESLASRLTALHAKAVAADARPQQQDRRAVAARGGN